MAQAAPATATPVATASTSIDPQTASEAAHLSFSNSLKQFCTSNEYSTVPASLGSWKSRPAKYIYGPLKVIDVSADVIINHPNAVKAVAQLTYEVVSILTKGGSNLKNDLVYAAWKLCADNAEAAKSWAQTQMEGLDEKDAQKAVAAGASIMEHWHEESSSILGLIKERAERSTFELVDIEAATRVLRVLLYHSHHTVRLMADRLPDAAVAKLAKRPFGYGAAAVGHVAACVVGAAATGPLLAVCVVGYFGTMVATGVGAYKTAEAVSNLSSVKFDCKQARTTLVKLDESIRGFCLYLGYLYNLQAAIGHLNDAQYIELVRKLNASLPRSVEEWSNPGYVKAYIEAENTELGSLFAELNRTLEIAGVQSK